MADIVVRAVKIKKRNSTMYKVAALVDNDESNTVDTVKVSINVNSGQPEPSVNPVICTDKDLDHDFTYNKLEFSSDAVGETYSVTTTMYDGNNDQIGDEQTFDVEVEDDSTTTLASTNTHKHK